MKMIIPTVMLALSGVFLYREYQEKVASIPAPKAEAPAQVAVKTVPDPMLDAKELENLHAALSSGDQSVRWAAMQSLYAMQDPKSMEILENAMTRESDPEIRVSIVLLLKTATDRNALKVLGLGVRDTDPLVRVASLRVIGEVGDLTATGVVAEAVNDAEDSVKLQAMDTLGQLQARRKAQYEELQGQLRHQYEEQVKKSQENAG